MKKLKRIICAAFAFVLVGTNFGGVIPVFADETDPTVRNPEPYHVPDGDNDPSNDVILYKTAKSVSGYANMWDVTLRIEAPKITTTSDTVLVIDSSYSMRGDPLVEAKNAAKSLVAKLLPESNKTTKINRVAVYSYDSAAHSISGFSYDGTAVANAIDGISVDHGTYTQGGLHAAVNLIANSTATYKNIVLLSDGEPNFSCRIDSPYSPDDYLIEGGPGDNRNEFQTSTAIPEAAFGNCAHSVGSASPGVYRLYNTVTNGPNTTYYYYNHGNSAIAEALNYRSLGTGELYTIMFETGAGDNGATILSDMAGTGHFYHSETASLDTIFQQIAGKILDQVNSAHVHDVMGEGVIVEDAEHSTEIDWDNITFTYDEKIDKYVAYYTYEVEAGEHILDEESTDGFHPLNENATLTYIDKDGKRREEPFPVPYVKPFFVNVIKEVEGQTCEEGKCVFDFKIEHPAGVKTTTYSVEAGKTHRIVEPFPIGDYTLTEIGETSGSGNPVKFENYLVSYTGNQFTIAEQHADHIDVTITNTYETVDLSASKVWDDDEDRDGLRSDYNDLYVVVKDGSNYVAYEKVTGAKTQSFEFKDLPKNRNGSAITYTLGEARCTGSGTALSCKDFISDGKYTSTVVNGVVTNTHKPDETTLTIKKKWNTAAGTLPTTTPLSVTVEVSNDKNNKVETVELQGSAYQEWSGEFKGFTNEGGQKINYTVTERKIGDTTFGNGKDTLYVYENGVLEGKWVATRSGTEITNTWTPATTVYSGSGAFNIEKLDQDGKAVPNVTFTVGDKNYTTGSNGKVKVEFSKSADKPEDSYSFNIKEIEAPEYYEVLEGTEVLAAKTNMELTVDEENLTNTYAKTFAISVKTVADGYVWQDSSKTLVVSDQALAKELVVEKTFEGITATAFENNSQISFEITGPKGFNKMTLNVDDNRCKMSSNKLTCTISGKDTLLPVGEYTVTENNADIANFTYKSEPTNGKVSQAAELGDSVKFSFKNTYEPAKTASYKVVKVWDDDNNRDGIQPEKLKVTLYAGNNVYGEPVELKADDWAYEWTKLPVVDENAETIQYSVKEAETSKYTSDGGKMVDGVFTFTNTHEPELINEDDDDPDNDGKLTVQKIWDGEGNELAMPDTVTVELYANGKRLGEPVVLSAAMEWKHTFEKLYKNENGKPIEYTVQESKLGETAFDESESTIIVYLEDGETERGQWDKTISDTNITNTWARSSAKSFTIKKTTVGVKAEVLKDVEFTVTGPEDFGDNGEMTLKIGNGCTASGYEITCTIDGKVPTGTYKVEEKNAEIENFTLVKVSGDNAAEKTANKNAEVVFEIENSYEKIRDVHYKVAKKWVDDSDRDGKRPKSLKITLLRNGSEYKTTTLDGDHLSYEWTDLPRADESGKIYEYSVAEEFVGKYDSDGGKLVDGVFTFTNTHEPELINEEDDDPDNDGKLTVQKIWGGKGNELVRPSAVTIELHAETKNDKGEVVKSWVEGQPVTISSANEWKHTFEGLYRYDNGFEITYLVEESKIGETEFNEDESQIIVYRDDAEIENGKWEKVISGYNVTNTWTRSMAKSLTIKKTTVGVLAEVLTNLEFTITGPEDFGENGEITLKIGEGCSASGYEITCTVDGDVPTGVYTVKESNAEIEYFTLVNVSGDNEVEMEADRDAEVVFEIQNEYESDKVSYGVVKIWDDEHDKDGKRPEELEVQLSANGEVVGTVYMSMADAVIIGEEDEEYSTGDVWVYVWEELPMADEYAELISYTAEEILESDDYEQTDMEGDEYYTLFVNSHELDDPCANGGCGGDIIPPVTPETGRLTINEESQSSQGAVVDNTFVLVVLMGVSVVVLYGAAKFAKRK